MDTHKTGLLPKACPNCRRRKVRCNRVLPCSNCLASGLTCRNELASVTQPLQISGHSADSLFRLLDSRLTSIEDAIKGFRSGHERSTCSPALHERSSSSPSDGICKEDTIVVEGESSFAHQTLLASQITELNADPDVQTPSVTSELANLRTIIKEHASPDAPNHNRNGMLTEGATAYSHELPPSDVVLSLLALVREEPGVISFSGLYSWKVFEGLCRRIYFPIEPISRDQLMLFYGAISSIARSVDLTQGHQLSEQEVDSTRRHCEKKFFQGVQTYEVMALPSRSRVFALYLAILHAQNEGELSLQWTLTSAAARHCIALDYHREVGLQQFPIQEAETVRRIFWQIYISDKNLSLRLGKASTIQDFDMDVGPIPISEDPARAPWDLALVACTNLARLQGCLYEGIYSVSARKHTKEERHEVVTVLAAKLAQWYDEWLHINSSAALDRALLERTFEPMHVIYFSVLTLLYRGEAMSNSASEISPRCFEAAHQGLQAHLAYYPKIASSGPQVSSYLLWIFYYTSFTPYVITFVRCVTTSSGEDLSLLKEVLDTLDQISSEQKHSKRQYELCKALYRTATEHLTSQSSASGHFGHTDSANWAWLDTNELLEPFMSSRPGDLDSITDFDNVIFQSSSRHGEHTT